MIKFQRIATSDTALYDYMEKLMTTSFPPEEYRLLAELRNYTDAKPHFIAISFSMMTIQSV